MSTDYKTMPDGEYFVDRVEKPIPAQSTWHDMSAIQLLEVKSALQTKFWAFRSNPQISTVLKQSISKIDVLIAQHSK